MFISSDEVEKIYKNTISNLEEEKTFLNEEDFKIVFKEEFLENLKMLN